MEINPSAGSGFKVMTVKEYTSRWKRCARRRRGAGSALTATPSCAPRFALLSNDDFPDCLSCGSLETKEHHFVQSWCRGRKRWESETFCCQCHAWNWRSYADPEFLMPEDFERLRWEATLTVEAAKKASHDALRPGAKVAGAVKAAA